MRLCTALELQRTITRADRFALGIKAAHGDAEGSRTLRPIELHRLHLAALDRHGCRIDLGPAIEDGDDEGGRIGEQRSCLGGRNQLEIEHERRTGAARDENEKRVTKKHNHGLRYVTFHRPKLKSKSGIVPKSDTLSQQCSKAIKKDI